MTQRPRPSLIPRIAAPGAVFLCAWALRASAQTGVNVALEDVERGAVLDALAKECYEAGMLAEMPSDSIVDCSAILDERSTAGAQRDADDPNAVDDVVVVRHRLRFTLLDRAREITVTADAWTDTEELGIAVSEPIVTEEYLGRVRSVLLDVGTRLRAAAGAPPPWAEHYETEQAWHLDAHLRAVRHCDANLASMRAESLGAQLESIGLRPLSAAVRDRCEQLYQHLFEWGLARGNTAPTPAAYASYRETLPPAQRACAGRLALEARCS